MINFNEYLNEDNIIPSLKAKTREEAIQILIDKIFSSSDTKQTITKEKAFEAVIQREKLQSTGIGKGLAFPHARIKGWNGFSFVAAACEEGIDFLSIDNIPVKCIFLMISSDEEPYVILQTMAAIVREITTIRENDDNKGGSTHFPTVLEKFIKKDVSRSKHLLAKDIASPVTISVKLETTLEEVTHLMHFKRKSIMPVVDKDNKLCGEISCYSVFDYGMPDFFKQLHTISFVKNIDPFEKYFKIQKDLKVKDLMEKDRKPVKEDTTIAEIVFEMTVKQRSTLFMVNDNGELTGVIDNFSIVDQILFF